MLTMIKQGDRAGGCFSIKTHDYLMYKRVSAAIDDGTHSQRFFKKVSREGAES